MTRVLEGVRVVEIASWTFVPAAGAALADWGAQVIKVEDVRFGDPARALVLANLTRENARVDRDYMMEIGNRGKRSIGLDLRTARGREILAELIGSADVFLTNWLPAARRRLKIDVDHVREMNPGIIYARGSGLGPLGAEAEKGGFDATSYMARGGVAYAATPEGSARPIDQSPALGDLSGGITLAGSIAAALYKRAVTGEPSVVDVSLLSQAVWTVAPDIMAADLHDIDRINTAVPAEAPNPAATKYQTRDGRWIQLMLLQPDRHWASFTRRIGRPDLAEDERFVPSSNLFANNVTAIEELALTFSEHDLAHWTKLLEDEEAVWSVVATPNEILADPQARANGYFITNVDEAGDEYTVVSNPAQFDGVPPSPSRAPEHGEHTEEILLEIGRDWDDIAALKDEGVVL